MPRFYKQNLLSNPLDTPELPKDEAQAMEWEHTDLPPTAEVYSTAPEWNSNENPPAEYQFQNQDRQTGLPEHNLEYHSDFQEPVVQETPPWREENSRPRRYQGADD